MLGKDFNKFQMLATVAALAVVTFVVTPLVSSILPHLMVCYDASANRFIGQTQTGQC
jgi:hypothetical protein